MKCIGSNIVAFPEFGRVVVKLDTPADVAKLAPLPGAKHRDDMVELPMGEDTCRILLNMGMTHALELAPFMDVYHPKVEGRYDPMRHQLMTAAFVTMNPKCYVLSDPRTGKTGSLVLAMHYLQQKRIVSGAWLIVATVTTMRSVWQQSIEATLPKSVTAVAHIDSRESALFTPGANFIVTNYDSPRLSTDAFTYAVQKGFIGGVVLDELTHVGNPESLRHKALFRIIQGTKLDRVVGITGSPADNTDAVYGMAHMVNPVKLPCKTLGTWKYMTSYKPDPEKPYRVTRAETPKIIHNTLQPAIRFKKQDILDLPPVLTQTRDCKLSTQQESVYKALRKQAVALAESGEVITASNGGVLFGKLMQVALGVANTEDGNTVYLDNTPRIQVILDAISETNRKVVIMCCYTAAIDDLSVKLRKAGLSTEVIDGRASGPKRDKILKAFQTADDPRVLVCHPTTTAYGVELAAADTLIFNGAPPLGGFIYAQALERLSSAKQKAESIQVIRVVSTYEERRMFSKLDGGKQLSGFVNELFELYRNAAYGESGKL